MGQERQTSNLPENDDFNWVKAHHECSLCFEFELLRRNVESSTKERIALLQTDTAASISYHSDNDILQVSRGPTGDAAGKSYCVLFRLEDDHISVSGATHQKPFCLTLTLNGRRGMPIQDQRKGRVSALASHTQSAGVSFLRPCEPYLKFIIAAASLIEPVGAHQCRPVLLS